MSSKNKRFSGAISVKLAYLNSSSVMFVESIIMPRKAAVASSTPTSPSYMRSVPTYSPQSPSYSLTSPSFCPTDPLPTDTHLPKTSVAVPGSMKIYGSMKAYGSWVVEKDEALRMKCVPEPVGKAAAPNYTRSQNRKLGCLCDPESEQNALLNNRP